ncbi:MAG: serine hydrolase domain-containing protein, partial [Fimbriimonadaceae bacterium]
FSYSNTGYFLLGMIVTKASGTEVGDFLERRVFKPVGLTNTYAIHRPEGVIPATGYHSRSGTRTAQPPIAWTSSLGAGAIVSTLEDMNKWDQALYTSKLLPDNLRNQLWSTATTTTGEPVNYGFGWFSGNYRGLIRQDHSGQTNGFTCYYYRFPEQRTMIMVHTNTYGGNVGGIANALSAHYVPGASYLKMKVPADPQPATTAEHLTMLKTSILGEGDMENFSPGIKDFATKDNFKSLREELKPAITTLKSFRLLVRRSPRVGSEVYIYRHEYEAKTFFLTMRFQGGKLSGLNWEDE